jgi:hypothetical protein
MNALFSLMAPGGSVGLGTATCTTSRWMTTKAANSTLPPCTKANDGEAKLNLGTNEHGGPHSRHLHIPYVYKRDHAILVGLGRLHGTAPTDYRNFELTNSHKHWIVPKGGLVVRFGCCFNNINLFVDRHYSHNHPLLRHRNAGAHCFYLGRYLMMYTPL